ncbi:MAG: type II toxin-antitoxin system YafQ family toxin (plasmid) [Candidatus Algichlamydia australiensis]|nr:type II toxin-antitoxin system YafQ family toxin [Chlamydiales bacterium]
MLIPVYERSFDKDLKRVQKRGYDLSKIKSVMSMLIREKPLPEKHRNHRLKGNFSGYWECHITPDWLLIYKRDSERIYFTKTGTHADLF